MHGNLAADVPGAPDSVHLTPWPADELAAARDEPLERAMAVARSAVELARTLRGSAGIRTRQPLARLWLALPGGDLADRDALLALIRDEVNVRAVELIGDESALVERRVKPLLPKIGKKHGSAIPAIMTAARENAVEYHADGSVTLGGVTLAADEVEILASPRPGTAVAHDQGLVVVIDTELTDELRAEGDARELQRAIQDLRKDAGLALDDRIELWLDGLADTVAAHLDTVADETLADAVRRSAAPADAGHASTVELGSGSVAIALRRVGGSGS
jgi:isoleucyl-tRNA synthetase